MKLSFRFVHGDTLGPWDLEAHHRIDDVAHRLRTELKPGQQVYARLFWDGAVLPPYLQLSASGLPEDAVVEMVWVSARPLDDIGNDVYPVLPRRLLKTEDLEAGTIIDVAGAYKAQALLSGLASYFTPKLQVLDIRQCALKPPTLTDLFSKLPRTLTELRASRNFFTGEVLDCLGGLGLSLRVLDVGYSHCTNCQQLPKLVGPSVEELGIGDLASLSADLLKSILSRCPNLKWLDCHNIFSPGSVPAVLSGLAESCPLLETFLAWDTEANTADLVNFLACCKRLAHLEIFCVSAEPLRKLSELPDLRRLRLQLNSADRDMISAVCSLRLETLVLHFASDVDEDSEDEVIPATDPLDLYTSPEELEKYFGESTATCFSLGISAVEPMVLQAIGSRLHDLGPVRTHGGEHSILGSLLLAPSCCVNLTELRINYYEQVDADTLAAVAAQCPLLQKVHLNADDLGFQETPIDKGVLSMGQHCPRIEVLDLYDRELSDPKATMVAAVRGWPKLRYLCTIGVTERGWIEVDPDLELVQTLAAYCPKLEELLMSADDEQGWDATLKASCPLYGDDELDSDEDEDEDEDEEDENFEEAPELDE